MKKIVLAFTMFLATAGIAFAQADLQPIVTVKLGKSETITLKQLKTRVGLFEKQNGKKLTLDERKSVLTAYVEEKLILQAAAKAGMAITDTQIDQYFIQQMSQQIGMPFASEKELDDLIIKTQGVNLDQFLKNQTGFSKAEYKSESVYLCTMCDGPMNHFHVQLIPRYSFEKRGSTNFVKERQEYVEDKDKIEKIYMREISYIKACGRYTKLFLHKEKEN